MEKELDIIEMEDGVNYAVMDAINYEGKTYVVLGKLNDLLDEIVDNELLIYEKINDEIVVINDNDLLEKLIKTFDKRLQNN